MDGAPLNQQQILAQLANLQGQGRTPQTMGTMVPPPPADVSAGTGRPSPMQPPPTPPSNPPGWTQSPTGSGEVIPQIGRIPALNQGMTGGGGAQGGGGGRFALQAGGPLGMLMAVGFAAHQRANEKKTMQSRDYALEYSDVLRGRGQDAASQWLAADNKRMRWFTNATDPRKTGGPEYQGVQQAYQQEAGLEQQKQQWQAQQAATAAQEEWKKAQAENLRSQAATRGQITPAMTYQAGQKNVLATMQMQTRRQIAQGNNAAKMQQLQSTLASLEKRTQITATSREKAAGIRATGQVQAARTMLQLGRNYQAQYNAFDKQYSDLQKQRDAVMKQQQKLLEEQDKHPILSRLPGESEVFDQRQQDLTDQIGSIDAQMDQIDQQRIGVMGQIDNLNGNIVMMQGTGQIAPDPMTGVQPVGPAATDQPRRPGSGPTVHDFSQ